MTVKRSADTPTWADKLADAIENTCADHEVVPPPRHAVLQGLATMFVEAATPPSTDTGTRFGATQSLLLLIAILVLGSALFLLGTKPGTVFTLLSGLGAIGAATLAAAGGGRRLLTIFAEAAARSSAVK
ncbi:hypothetical protein [Streptomyces sp. NPDC002746]